MKKNMSESDIEQAAMDWLNDIGWQMGYGPGLAPGEPGAERRNYAQVVLENRLRQALERLNPEAPPDALEEAFRKLTRPDLPSLVAGNQLVHRYFVDGVLVEYQRSDGSLGGVPVQVFDYENPENNEFLAVNQFTVVENWHRDICQSGRDSYFI